MAALLQRFPAGPADARQQPQGTDAQGAVANGLRQKLEASQVRRQAVAQSNMPLGERARTLALMASGLVLSVDYGQWPLGAQLGPARANLAEALEWQRRAQAYQSHGFSLARLQAAPVGLLLSSLALLLAALAYARARPVPLALWGLATLLLGAGSVLLCDVALTGDPALRYLAERQFIGLNAGGAWLPLLVALPVPGAAGSVLWLWLPVLATAIAVVGLGLLRRADGAVWAPVLAWVRAGSDHHWGWGVAQALLLLALGLGLVMFLGMPAAVSELLILLGCLGVAGYVARQAAFANTGAAMQWGNLTAAAAALLLAVGGALVRGDLGHALVALVLAACFAWLFGWQWMRWCLCAGLAVGVTAWAACMATGELVGPLAWLTNALPAHAQDRMYAMFDPFQASASDLARVRWLMQSAGESGWGAGYVPWQGLTPVHAQDGLPLQGPSDYVLAMTTALWGQTGGLVMLVLALALFVGAAVQGLLTALRPGMPLAVRWLASVGGLGCVMLACKILLSMGGVAGVLPLTGLPVSLLGYGPMSLAAALLYLALALGTEHVQPVLGLRGVNIKKPLPSAGAVRGRGLVLATVSTLGLLVLAAAGWRQVHADAAHPNPRHVARAHLELAQSVAQAMEPGPDPVVATMDADMASACPQWKAAVDAWNLQLANLSRAVKVPDALTGELVQSTGLHLNAKRLWDQAQTERRAECAKLSRTLGQLLGTDLSRLVGKESVRPENSSNRDELGVFAKPRAVGANPMDYSTSNAWWGRPGCLWPATDVAQRAKGQLPADVTCPPTPAKQAAQPQPDVAKDWLTDAWLKRYLGPQLFMAQRTPVAQTQWNHHSVAVGPMVGVTLEQDVQKLAQLTTDCATARLHGPDCAAVWPNDAAWREHYYGRDHALRAGAMGIVVAEVDTGRVVALAGALSDCSLTHLGQAAHVSMQGRTLALWGQSDCAQLPDKKSAWLAQQAPALWMVPPGSSIKPLSVVAGIDAGLVAPQSDNYWKGILALSEERLPVQQLALSAGQRYLDVLAGAGFEQPQLDLLWGGPVLTQKPALGARWATTAYAGTQGLRTTTLGLPQVEAIRQQKQGQGHSGINVDTLYGQAVMTEYTEARRVADVAIGGADVRINAVGLVDMWRALDLRARGQQSSPALHLLEQPGTAVPSKKLDWLSTQAAHRVLDMTTGVTASAWKGTAQGSCRVVLGQCPAQGLAGVSGKTGTADFLDDRAEGLAKPGLQLPAKLYGGVFAGANGKRYAIAVMALRVRDPSQKRETLELHASAPAEAALTVMRQMGAAKF